MNITTPRYEHGQWLRSSDTPLGLPDDVQALFRYWAELAGPQGAPTRSQIDPLTHFPRLMPTTMLIGIESDAAGAFRYRYRIAGSELTARAGQSLTGRYLDEVFPPDQVAPDFEIYRRCIAEQTCYWGRRSSVIDTRKDWEIYNRIILPILRPDSDSVGFLWIYIWFDG